MDVRELCRKLKPFIGDKAERCWLLYLSEDAEGKRELERALQLLAARHLGNNVDEPEARLSAPPAETALGPYRLGDVTYSTRNLHPFGLREDELIQHVAVFGRSGAGKTNTIYQLLDTFRSHRKPWLLFDWKRNYRDLLAMGHDDILVYTVGRDIAPLVFNPLIPPEGTDPRTWLKKLIEIIAHAYFLGEGVMFLLQEAIDAVYQEFGVYAGAPEAYPTFADVAQHLEKQHVKGRQALWMDSARRGIKSICFGHMGSVVNTSSQPSLGLLLERNVILELDALTNADKTLLTEGLLLWIHHYRMAQGDRETFKHAILIEEAHHILTKQAGHGPEAITETVLREIRELGESIVLVDQHPSMIAIPALGNTYATICMNLKHRADVSAVGAAMLLGDEEKELLGRLPVGSAIVKLQGRWPSPFEVVVPRHDIPKGSVTDSQIGSVMLGGDPLSGYTRRTMEGTESVTQEPVATVSNDITEGEQALLLDIAKEPLSGVVERYKRLGANRRKGNQWKESCLGKGLIEPVDIITPAGKVVLLKPTVPGLRLLRDLGHDMAQRSRWGGLEHEYWKLQVVKSIEQAGGTPAIEQNGNGFTDITLPTLYGTIAIEIETGKSDWQENIWKNLAKGHAYVIVAATDSECYRKLESALTEGTEPKNEQVEVVLAYDLTQLRGKRWLQQLLGTESDLPDSTREAGDFASDK